jgi:hypothetical protein
MFDGLLERIGRHVAHDRALGELKSDLHRVFSTRVDRTSDGAKIGFATFGAGEWHLGFELLLAAALEQRNARPSFLICDLPDLPICSERLITSTSQDRCAGCLLVKREVLDISAMPWERMSAFIGHDAITRATRTANTLPADRIEDHVERGFPVGRWLHVSACNFLRGDARGDAPEHVDVRRRLLATAIVGVEAVDNWLARTTPDIVVVQGGAHTLWRIARELSQARGIPVISRELGKGGWDRQIFALNRDSMAPDLDEAWNSAREQPLTEAEEAEVDALASNIAIDTYQPIERQRQSATRLNIDPSAKVAVAFTNVTWDLATADRDVAFTGVFDWLTETMRALRDRPGVQLIVRAHPAEASVMTRERIVDRIAADWPDTSRITIVPPEHSITARDLFDRADIVLAYNSTAGLEAAMHGRPVIVCGSPHFRGRGFTIDIDTRAQYRELLAGWSGGASVDDRIDPALARRYFHLFFARYHVTMGWTTSPLEPPYRLLVRSAAEMAPGRNAALDRVCEGILRGRQILRPREEEESPCAR